jgi:hypothetical protein
MVRKTIFPVNRKMTLNLNFKSAGGFSKKEEQNFSSKWKIASG